MMIPLKKSVFALLIIALASVAHAGDFLTDFETAKKQAAADKKPLLVKFTGSDWCPPCIMLHQEVFSKKAFKTAVEKDFVVVILDFPQTKKLPEGQAEANKEVAEKYGLSSYPTVMLMDHEGKVFKSMSGYGGGGVKPYLKALKDSLRARKFQ